MGYYTMLSGELKVDPPLKWSQIKGHPALEFWNGYDALRIGVDSSAEETDDGTRTIKRGTRVEPYTNYSCKAYENKKSLAQLVAEFPGHTFLGEIHGDGEETGDYWRLYVDQERRTIMEKARMVWPDGSPVVLDG